MSVMDTQKSIKKLRINADDFGLTKGVTDGVLYAHLNGIVTHTSIMAQGLDFQRAVQIAKDTPSLGIGCHLNVSWGKPLLPVEVVSTLVSKEGKFFTFGQVTLRSFLRRIDRKQLVAEWKAQIEKVLNTGLILTHLDSHHHLHLLPTCFQVIKELSQFYQIPYLRKPSEKLSLSEPSLIKRIIFYVLCMRSWPQPSSDTFFGLSLQETNDYSYSLKKIIGRVPFGLTELMVHPGWIDYDLTREDSMLKSREIELVSLCDPTIKDFLLENKIILDRP